MEKKDNKDNSIIQRFIQKTFLMLNNDETKKYIQIYILDPLLNHILERIFPYIILTTVLFIILILSILGLFAFIYFNFKYTNNLA